MPKTRSLFHPDVIIIIILILLPFLFFWRLVAPNPADRMVIAAGDFTEQYFPLRAFAAQQWVRGEIPLWNPYLFGGQPALADIQSGALYPPHVLQSLILGWSGLGFPLAALEWQVIGHLSIAAVGMYLFARHLACAHGAAVRHARFGGLMASLVFTYGGYLTGFPVQQLTILEVSAWLPWVMWGVSESANGRMGECQVSDVTHHAPRTTPALRASLCAPLAGDASRLLAPPLCVPRFASPAPFWGAIAFALAILAGHPQTVMYIFYLSLAYTVFRCQVSSVKCQVLRTTHHALRFFIPWLIIIGLGTALAAAQLLPTLEFIGRSLRADLSYQAVSAGLPLNELVSILYPGFLGGSPEYVGIVTLVLMALALLIRPKSPITNNQTRDIFFWVGAGIVSLVLAFGGNTFLYPLFYLLLPGFESVRQQERVYLIYSFSAAILAGYGALVLVSPLSQAARRIYTRLERRLRQIALLAAGLTAFFIYGSGVSTARGDEVNLFYGVLQHHLFGLIILGGLLVLLTLRSRRWLRRSWGMGLLALWLAFNLFTVNWRYNLAKPANPATFTPNGVIQFLQSSLPAFQPSNPTFSLGRIASGGLLPGSNSAASVYNLQDLTGNTPLQLAAVDSFLRRMPSWRAWQLLNAQYVVERRNIADAGLTLVYEEGEVKVFKMGDPFDRAWWVGQIEVIADEAQALARLAADDFDLRRSAVVSRPLPLPLDADTSTVSLTITAWQPNYLQIQTQSAGQHLLVVSQIYDSGWQAALDGQSVTLWQVNTILQGVLLSPGAHTLELRYSPPTFWWGVVISSLTLLLCLGGLLWTTKKQVIEG
ncbi:MAG: YfhO family protein [Anaerolineae bacterium]